MSLKLKTIAIFDTVEESHIVLNVLQNEGVAAYLNATNVAGALGLSGSLMREVKLQVAEADEHRARDILARKTAIRQGGGGVVRICQECGAKVPSNFEMCWSCQAPIDGEDENSGPHITARV